MPKDGSAKSFVLRIDAQTMAEVEKWAADEFRSVNGQLQWMIVDSLRRAGRRCKNAAKFSTDTDEWQEWEN